MLRMLRLLGMYLKVVIIPSALRIGLRQTHSPSEDARHMSFTRAHLSRFPLGLSRFKRLPPPLLIHTHTSPVNVSRGVIISAVMCVPPWPQRRRSPATQLRDDRLATRPSLSLRSDGSFITIVNNANKHLTTSFDAPRYPLPPSTPSVGYRNSKKQKQRNERSYTHKKQRINKTKQKGEGRHTSHNQRNMKICIKKRLNTTE